MGRRSWGRLLAKPVLFTVLTWIGPSLPSAGAAGLFLADTPFEEPRVNRIYRVDPLTGDMTLQADLGTTYEPVLGLAAASDTLFFAIGSDFSGKICPGSGFACLLLRIDVDPVAPSPRSVTVVGAVTVEGEPLAEIVGLNFRNTGDLYATSQADDGLYILDTETARATLVGISNVDLYGGDLTFDESDRLWVWVNVASSSGAGFYELDPETARGTQVDGEPTNMAGLTALGHGSDLRGAETFSDRLSKVIPDVGKNGEWSPLSYEGVPFDHKRGDMDSPFCAANSACEDGDPCTADVCAPGGCLFPTDESICDGLDDDCDMLVDEGFPDLDADGQADCVDPDDDDDGTLDEIDCAPWDEAEFEGTPSEVTSVRWESPPATLSWDAQGPGVFYDVLHGDLSDLRTDGDPSGATCLADHVIDNRYRDVRLPPTAGTGVYYLIRAQKDGCGTGTYGFSSEGPERVPTVDCP